MGHDSLLVLLSLLVLPSEVWVFDSSIRPLAMIVDLHRMLQYALEMSIPVDCCPCLSISHDALGMFILSPVVMSLEFSTASEYRLLNL